MFEMLKILFRQQNEYLKAIPYKLEYILRQEHDVLNIGAVFCCVKDQQLRFDF